MQRRGISSDRSSVGYVAIRCARARTDRGARHRRWTCRLATSSNQTRSPLALVEILLVAGGDEELGDVAYGALTYVRAARFDRLLGTEIIRLWSIRRGSTRSRRCLTS